jgi:hypothetical protein
MQSKIIFVVLFMLSFSVFHDSIMPYLEKNKHTDMAHYASDTISPIQECADFNEIHSMLHFVAIVTLCENIQIQFDKIETISHLLVPYNPPLKKSSYKPPIV